MATPREAASDARGTIGSKTPLVAIVGGASVHPLEGEVREISPRRDRYGSLCQRQNEEPRPSRRVEPNNPTASAMAVARCESSEPNSLERVLDHPMDPGRTMRRVVAAITGPRRIDSSTSAQSALDACSAASHALR